LNLDLSTGGNDSFRKMVPAVDCCARPISDAPAGFYSAEAREIFREFTVSRSDELDNLSLVFAFANKANMSGRNPAVAVDQKGRRE
jgi:hypothetical protein